MTKTTCPFCFYQDELNEFCLPITRGISQKQYKCPDCYTIMRSATLKMKLDITQYAKWVKNEASWPNTHSRIKWNRLKERLRERNLASQFWSAYMTYDPGKEFERDQDSPSRVVT